MKIVAIIQARIGSTRLPGKVLMDLGGKPVLVRVVERTRRAKMLDGIMVATTDLPADDGIAVTCAQRGWACFRGSEKDVLDRYYQAAHACGAGAVVRITSDCPLIDTEIVDLIVGTFLGRQVDYASNDFPPTYPRGLDAEVFTMAALTRAWDKAKEAYQREHVTPFMYEHPDLFSVASVRAKSDYSGYRWTLDTPEDLQLIREIYRRFGNRDDFGWREVLSLMQREPELATINAHAVQKSFYQV
jgi:spore coat polysaccharide biosynthesis protein SpsF (cytidylyltransferase family)